MASEVDDDALATRVPDPVARAGLSALAATIAEPLLDAFLVRATRVTALGLGAPATPGRVVGPPPDPLDPGARVVNDRYRAEHPALLAASLVDRFVDALDRGRACTVDVMGELDLFAHKDERLDDVGGAFGVRAPTFVVDSA